MISLPPADRAYTMVRVTHSHIALVESGNIQQNFRRQWAIPIQMTVEFQRRKRLGVEGLHLGRIGDVDLVVEKDSPNDDAGMVAERELRCNERSEWQKGLRRGTKRRVEELL